VREQKATFGVREQIPTFRVREQKPTFRAREQKSTFRAREQKTTFRVREQKTIFRVYIFLNQREAKVEEFDGPAVRALGVRSRKLSNAKVSHRMGDQFCDLEGTISH
jgi:hypothetical protein